MSLNAEPEKAAQARSPGREPDEAEQIPEAAGFVWLRALHAPTKCSRCYRASRLSKFPLISFPASLKPRGLWMMAESWGVMLLRRDSLLVFATFPQCPLTL